MSLDDRLRTPPRERLAGLVQQFTLSEAAAELRTEEHPPVSGHRQLALVRHGPLSLILFAFDAEGAIPEHRTEGEVVIHVLRGKLVVTVDGDDLELSGGTMISLAPSQPHAVRALESSDMLLTICRDPAG